MMAKDVPRRYRRVTERYVSGHKVSLLRGAETAYPAMLVAIEQARQQVLLEMYWFDSDRTGQRFAAALVAAAARGVEVAVIYDSLGSIEANEEMFEGMRRAGVRVLEYNPIEPWHERFRVEALTRRDHRKILVVDGQIGFTGGINICDKWLAQEEGGEGWRDDMVRIEGPAVRGFIDCFASTWEDEGAEPLQTRYPETIPPPSGDGSSIDTGPCVGKVRVLGEAIHKQRREIVRAYLYHIYRARQRVWIANSYFVPDARILKGLVWAALRGVDVRVLVPGKSDIAVVRVASQAAFDRLLRAGVRIYEWQTNVLHTKTAVIDGEWSTIGTFNFDYRSLLVNLEVNVSIEDAGFGSVMEEAYLADLERSIELEIGTFARRSLPRRLVEQTLYRFRSLL